MIVLDASALVDVLLDQESAHWVLDAMEPHDVAAPAHQLAEVLSAVARLERNGTLDVDAARSALTAATTLPQELVTPSAAHVRRAFDLRRNIRVLDALYVALAEERGAALLTTDDRLIRADPPCEVLTP